MAKWIAGILECWNTGLRYIIRFFHYSIILRYRLHMSLFKRFFFSQLVLTPPGWVFGAATPVRIKIGTASFSSSTLSLWIAQERGIFTKHGIEAQTILIGGGPPLVASLMAGDINVAFTSGVSVLVPAPPGIAAK